MRLQVGDVERLVRFALIGVVVHDRALADHHFRDRVVEVDAVRHADEGVADPHLAVLARDHQHPRMGGDRSGVAAGDGDDVNRRVDHRALGDEHGDAVIQE